MGVASIEPQEAAASLFYCVIMYAPSHKYLTHVQQITFDGCEKNEGHCQ